MSAKRLQNEVLVVGAGPVGLTAASLLAERGIRPRIVDRETRSGDRSYALILHPDSLALLDPLELADAAIEDAARIESIAFYSGRERRAEITFAGTHAGFPFAAILQQDTLEQLLLDRLRAGQVGVDWSHGVAALRQGPERVTVSIDRWGEESRGYAIATVERVIERTTTHEFNTVIGADGHRSTVRRALDIPSETTGPSELWAVFEFACDASLDSQARIVLDDATDSGPTTSFLWPLPDDRCRWSFQLGREDSDRLVEGQRLATQIGSDFYPHLPRQELLRLIERRAPWFDAEIGGIDRAIAVRFDQCLAARFGAGRCGLAGDAAHLAGPVAGQSINLGLLEAADLAAAVLAGREGPGPAAFEQYAAAAQARWRRTAALDARAAAEPSARPWVRDHADRILRSLPASGRTLDVLAGQLGLRLA